MHDVDDGSRAATIACRFGNALLLVESAGESPPHDDFDGSGPVHRHRGSPYVCVRHGPDGPDGPARVDVVAGDVVPGAGAVRARVTRSVHAHNKSRTSCPSGRTS